MVRKNCHACGQSLPERIEGECCVFRGYHIPGCWGCVINGHEQCTCSPAGQAARGKNAFFEDIADEPTPKEIKVRRTFLRLLETEVDRG